MNEQYRNIDAVNHSTLKYMAESPLHYKHNIDNPKPTTDAMRLGTAAHMAILEPPRFLESVVYYEGRRAGKSWEQFAVENQDRLIVRAHEYDHCLKMSESVWFNPDIKHLLQNGYAELSITWNDEYTGLFCKGRIDFMTKDGYLVDLKTTRSIVYRDFQRTYAQMHYFSQLAFYYDGLIANGHDIKGIYIIAVENKPPYDAGLFEVDMTDIERGRDKYRLWLEMLQECRTVDRWPGRYQGSQFLSLPSWAVEDDSDDIGDLDLNFHNEGENE